MMKDASFRDLMTGAGIATDKMIALRGHPKQGALGCFEVSEQLRAFARRIGKPLSQVAINWLINQDVVASVISGGQIPGHVEENAGSVSWELTDEMMEEIEQILQRYKEAALL